MLFNNYIEGFEIHKNFIGLELQKELLDACRRVIALEPLWRPKFVGKGFVTDFALENTNCGLYGWLGDETGFRYQKTNRNGEPWEPIPDEILAVAREVAPADFEPQNCLINFYRDLFDEEKQKHHKSHLGLHQDRTENNRTAPIISISLGQSCIFQIGGLNRKDAVQEVLLDSGDVVVMGGGRNGARNAYHGVKCLLPNTTPTLLGMKSESRINITVRQVY